ncbi:MetQ/NlpA family ABC transporter substrate-binding protein (plasmid) [Coraliomargarita sp. W4R53]
MSVTTRFASAIVGVAAVSLALTACAGTTADSDTAPSTSTEDLGTLVVGATAVPAGEILAFVQDNLADDAGLDLEITEFSDYNTPNPALAQGATDANLFQHAPFLDLFVNDSGDDLVSVGEIYLPPLALYSETVASIEDLPDGAEIALPNDASNESRALLLLADAGLIETTEAPSTIADITANPRGFEFTEIDAASLPTALQQQDAAIVNFSFAAAAGLNGDLQILTESTESPYFNILATRGELIDDPRIVTLYELLTSAETQEWIIENYNGLVIPAE